MTAVIVSTEAAWRMRCELASAESAAGLAMGGKMRVAAKVQTLLYKLKRMHVSSIVEATAAQIMSRPDKEIEAWVSRNERFLKTSKKDTAQRTPREYFATKNWEGG